MLKTRDNVHLPLALHKFEVDGITVIAPTVKQQVEAMTAAMNKRGIPVPPDLENTATEIACAKVPHFCSRVDAPTNKRIYSVTDVRAFLEAVRGTIKSGGVVKQEVAERRTNICMSCPNNKNLQGCQTCSGIGTAVFAVIGARTTGNMGHLKQCAVCGCSLKAKIWVPEDVLLKTAQIQNNLGDFPEWCWVKK